MFVKVTALRDMPYQGARKEGDTFFMRRQDAKIAKALKKVSIHEGSETVSPNIAVTKVPKTINKAVVAEETPPQDAPLEETQTPPAETLVDTPQAEETPVETPAEPVVVEPVVEETTAPKKRRSKYDRS